MIYKEINGRRELTGKWVYDIILTKKHGRKYVLCEVNLNI